MREITRERENEWACVRENELEREREQVSETINIERNNKRVESTMGSLLYRWLSTPGAAFADGLRSGSGRKRMG